MAGDHDIMPGHTQLSREGIGHLQSIGAVPLLGRRDDGRQHSQPVRLPHYVVGGDDVDMGACQGLDLQAWSMRALLP